MFRLLIENEEVELNSNGVITLNKLILDLEDFSLRGINFTNTITLPITSKNNRLTGYPSHLSSANDSFEIRKEYTLFNNSTIISKGNVILKSYDEKEGIKIQLAEGSDFWNVAGSKLLYDLRLEEDDFEFSNTNMNDRKVKTSSVFLTALHSATNSSSGTALQNYNATRPCYLWINVLNKLIAQLGYTVDYTNVLERTDLNNLGCLSNCEKFFVSDYKTRFVNVVETTGVIDYTGATDIFTKSGNVSESGGVLTNARYETSYVIKGYVTSAIRTELRLQVNGDIEIVIIPKGRSFINFKTDELEIGENFIINFDDPVTLEDVYVYSAINEDDIFSEDNSLSVSGFLVLADYNLPQQTQKQFIKNIITLNFLDFTIDENTKNITFKYVPDVINTNNSIDFSGKVERYFTIERGDIYGQLSIFKYQNDEFLNKNRGAAFINIRDENAPNVKEIIHIKEYSASREIQVSNNNMLLVDIYTTGDNTRKSVRDRICLFKEEGTFGFNASFTSIGWQRLYAKHYVDFIQATRRERLISFSAYLTNLDYRSLQKNPVIYIDFLQSTFLVTEIEGFQRNEKCKIKCIKYN